MLKKGTIISIIFSTTISLLLFPFSIHADQINGFDYTNYYELEYIASSGTQYINLGPVLGSDFEVKMQLTTVPSSARGYFGNAAAGNYYFFGFFSNYSQLELQTNTYKWRTLADTNVHTYILNGLTFSDNGVSSTVSSYSLSDITVDCYMFRSNGLVYSNLTSMKLYYAIFGNHQFYPAERKSDGEIGLFDIYDETFYTNQGTGDFIAGDRIIYPDPEPDQSPDNITISPSGSGNVTAVNNSDGTQTLTATPSDGYVFGSWSDGVVSNPRTVSANSQLTVNFIDTSAIYDDILIGYYSEPIGISTYDLSTYSNLTGTITNNTSSTATITLNTSSWYRPNHGTQILWSDVFVLNDQYIGYVDLTYSYTSSGNTVNDVHRVYVNSNTFHYNRPVYYADMVIECDFSHLYRNQSSESLIANGTSESSESSNQLNNSSDDMNDSMNDLVSIEDGYNDQFNNSLNNIDFSNPLSGNNKLLTSANFVITVFNGLISNNFLSTLIVIICILLIGKKVIGK